jgi:purine-cytosine permease-like protein
MIAGTVYIVFGGDSFFGIFQGFLITLGVPIAVWAGIMLADVLLRKKNYADSELFNPRGRYGSVSLVAMATLAVGSFVGWGFVVNTYAGWLSWQGYLMDVIGGKEGAWAYSNLGVLFALAIGFLATLLLKRGAVRRQEEQG